MTASALFRARFVPTSAEHGVTTLELFFDLVFVFAITQVTTFMAEDLGWRSAVRGLVVLALLWWAWSSYAWLGNQVRADEGIARLVVLLAMAALFLGAMALPEAWSEDASLPPLLLAATLAAVRLLHLGAYAAAAGDDAGLRHQLAKTAVPVSLAAVLLVLGAVLGGSAQTALWLAALVVDYGGIYAAGSDWRLTSPRHFAERYGLIVLIALGESLIAVGVGLAHRPVTGAVILVAMLGLTSSVAMWWAYFDVVAPVAERVLHAKTGSDRVRLARDSYTYLHFPMIAGIIYLALGLKKVAEYVSDTEHHSLSEPLATAALWALYGGVAAYLLAHLAFRKRNVGSINPARAVAAAVVLLAPLVLVHAPALVALAVLTLVLVLMIGYEVVHNADARAAVRRAEG